MSEEPENIYPWLPLSVGAVEIVGWDGYSYVDTAGRTYWSGEEPSESDAVDAVTTPRTPPAPGPHRVTRDEIWQRVKAVLGEANAYAMVQGFDDQQRIEWYSNHWFWSNNPAVRGLCTALGLDPDVILAPDPLAP